MTTCEGHSRLTRSVNESSSTEFIVWGKMNAIIAIAISAKKKTSRQSE